MTIILNEQIKFQPLRAFLACMQTELNGEFDFEQYFNSNYSALSNHFFLLFILYWEGLRMLALPLKL